MRPLAVLIIGLTCLPAIAQPSRLLERSERDRLVKAVCEPVPCADRAFGGCDSALCADLEFRARIGPDANEAKKQYDQQCVERTCPIASPEDMPIGPDGTTVRSYLEKWSSWTPQGGTCESRPVTTDEILLPAERAESFDKVLEHVRCGEQSKVGKTRSLAASRNLLRCAFLRAADPDPGSCPEGVPCGAAFSDVAPWLSAERKICPADLPGTFGVCSSRPQGAKGSYSRFGASCPPPNMIATNKDCRLDVTPKLPTETTRAELGKDAEVFLASAVLPLTRDSGLWMPGAHRIVSMPDLSVSTRAEYAWSAAPVADAMGGGARFVVLTRDLSKRRVMREAYTIANPPVRTESAVLAGWTAADFAPLGYCGDSAKTACSAEFAHFQTELVLADATARPWGSMPVIELPMGTDMTTRRRCYTTASGVLCVEHRGAHTLPAKREPRTVAWRPFLDSPLLGPGLQNEIVEVTEAYLRWRQEYVPTGTRIGVIAAREREGGKSVGLVGVTGEPSSVVLRSPDGQARVSRLGPLAESYVDALADAARYQPGKSEDDARTVVDWAMSIAPGILVTDPLRGRGKLKGVCGLTGEHPVCLRPGRAPYTAVGLPVTAGQGLELFTDAYREMRLGQTSAGAWRKAQSVLESMLAVEAPPKSLVGVLTSTAGDALAVLLEELKSNNPCAGKVQVMPVPSDPRSPSSKPLSFVLVTGSGDSDSCARQFSETTGRVVAAELMDDIDAAIAAVGGSSSAEVHVVLNAQSGEPARHDIVVFGSSGVGNSANTVIALADPRLPNKTSRQLATVIQMVTFKGTVDRIDGRAAFVKCFSERSCAGPGKKTPEPIAFFPYN